MPYVPKQGDLAWLTFDPRAGHEQGGRRPALILSPTRYNRQSGLCLVCPVTSRVKGYPFEVAIPSDLPVSGVVLADHVSSLDWQARNAEYISAAPDALVSDVAWKISRLLPPA